MSRTMSVEVDGHGAGIHFSAAHFLVHHDKCERVHGHNYLLSAVAEGSLDGHGMVIDFTVLKKALRAIVAELDHRVILPRGGEVSLRRKGGEVRIERDDRTYSFPADDVIEMDIPAVTAEHLASALLDRLMDEVPTEGLHSLAVGVEEGPGQTAWARTVL